ncbi:MAG: hypothetical protein KF837_23245, partial [Labilithrix sp.]|nr:hypothetical protein [Labilithrix sp.]
ARLLAASAERAAAAKASASAPAASAPETAAERGHRETNDIEEYGRFISQAIRDDFVPLARDCAKQLAARKPDAHGTAVVAFELLGDAKIGGVVNEAEIDHAKSDLVDPEFETCVSESLMSVYFDPPPAGGRATLSFPVHVLEGEAGAIDEEVEDFHLKDRR